MTVPQSGNGDACPQADGAACQGRGCCELDQDGAILPHECPNPVVIEREKAKAERLRKESERAGRLAQADAIAAALPKQCMVKIKNGSCASSAAVSGIMNGGVGNDAATKVYDLDNSGLSGWGDQDGESVLFKGDCKNIRINDVDRADADKITNQEDDPVILENMQADDWECINFYHSAKSSAKQATSIV